MKTGERSTLSLHMKIIWFTWKDLKHPQAGGAEFINEEIAARLIRDGHEVIMLVAGFAGCQPEEIRNGYKIVRFGNRYTVYWRARWYYRRHLASWADLVIDEMNTIPFFCKYYVEERNILFAYQLCREIWFYQMPFPISFIGYLLEPIYLRLLNDRTVITESESTKRDLLRYGYDAEKINIISVGVITRPVDDLDAIAKYNAPTVLSLGSLRGMKRTKDQITAFEMAKQRIPELQMKIAGATGDRYGREVLAMARRSPFHADIEYLGAVSEEKKTELMRKSHAILVTSVKEGWGLIVTEANSQGTPAVAYDVDGLRDSIKHGNTGIICEENNPQHLADAIASLLRDKVGYERLRRNAWLWSRELTFERCYESFLKGIAP